MGALRADFGGLPPAVVAHRLADGRYAIDDEVTRTALRALCPAAPSSGRAFTEALTDSEYDRVSESEALFLDGFCHRVWGASIDDAVARVRSIAQASTAGTFGAETLAAVAAALRATPVPLELDAVDAPPLALVPAAPPEAPPVAAATIPDDARCAPVLRANNALRGRANQALTRATLDATAPALNVGEDARFCAAHARGLWTLSLTRFAVVRGDDPHLDVDGVLAWRPTGPGVVVTLPTRLAMRVAEMDSDLSSLVAAPDYDGDGTPEVFVRRATWEHEGDSTTLHTLYTLRDGAIRPYAPATPFAQVDDVVDADHDGRLDLVLPTRWRVIDECGMSGIEHLGPALLAHALTNGSLSTDDDVARGWTRARCSREGGADPDVRVDVLDVACARLAGEPPERVGASLQARAPAGAQRRTREVRGGLCLTFQELAATALVPLPFEFGARPTP